MNLEGKTALVVGGGTGIGYGIAKAFANAGCRVVISGRREEILRQASETAGSISETFGLHGENFKE